MSRIGNSPISIPEGVTVTVDNAVIKVAGPKGELEQAYDNAINIEIADNVITLTRPSEDKDHRSKHGLYRALIYNMIEGVSQGFTVQLQMVGVGYKAEVKGDLLSLKLGFSHSIELEIPNGVKVSLAKSNRNNLLILSPYPEDVRDFGGQIPKTLKALGPPLNTICRLWGQSLTISRPWARS